MVSGEKKHQALTSVLIIQHEDSLICDYSAQTRKVLEKDFLVTTIQTYPSLSWKKVWNKREKNTFSSRENAKFIQFFDILPGKRFQIIRALNFTFSAIWILLNLFLQQRLTGSTLVWFFSPHALPLLFFLFPLRKVFDVVDFFPSLSFWEKKAFQVGWRKSDQITVISPALQHLVETRIEGKWSINQVPAGFAQEDALTLSPTSQMNSREVGYLGGVNNRLNYPLLISLAERFPTVKFVYIGPLQTAINIEQPAHWQQQRSKLLAQPNVEWVAQQERRKALQRASRFSVALIPYRDTDVFNQYSLPMKLFEYFALELPILASHLPALTRFLPHIHLAHSVSEWHHKLSHLLQSNPHTRKKYSTRHIAWQHAWEKKVQTILQLLG